MKRWAQMTVEERAAAIIALLPEKPSGSQLMKLFRVKSRDVVLGFCRRNGISLRTWTVKPRRANAPLTRKYEAKGGKVVSQSELLRTAREFWESQPQDTRDLTQRLAGDPPFHRSALAQKRGEARP